MSLRDYMKELEEIEAKNEEEGKETKFTDLFKGEEAPTQEDLDAYAEENEMSPEDVSKKIIDMLFDALKEEESEEDEDSEEGESKKKSGGADSFGITPTKAINGDMFTKAQFGESEELDEEEDAEHEAGETEEEETAEHAEGGSEEIPFAKGDTVSYSTDDPESIFFGKKLQVVATDDNGFVQVLYIDTDGKQTEIWFKNDEVKLEDKGEGSTDIEDEVVAPADEPSFDDENKNESFGISAFLKTGIKYFRG